MTRAAMMVIGLALSLVRTAAADDSLPLDLAATAGVFAGPIPSDSALERAQAIVGVTIWNRVHVGIGAGIGTGGNASWFAEGFGELGMWLHPSEKLDLLLAWRLGRAHFAIFDMPVNATMGTPVIELRYRLRPRLAIVVEPFETTGYYHGLWEIVIGPQLGVAVPL
jgi:hypothetical protein